VEFAKLKSRVLESKGVNVNIFGSIEELPPKTQDAVKNLCSRTTNNNELYLNIALNYGSRKEIVDAVKNIIGEYRENNEIYNEIDEEYIKNFLYSKNIPDPDFLIRTSGEQRLSNFLLYQLAYTELYFTETLWPDFGKEEYIKALKEYEKRNRRYGTS
jgi:undecaprenyl diphosphate synthase